MATLNENAARVSVEFGRLSNNLIQFEDVAREFLQVRSLELQRLGISDTEKTVVHKTIKTGQREGNMAAYGNFTPAFCEYIPNNAVSPDLRYKVAIIPVDQVPEYEGGRAIAFFGNPRKYRAAWDFWENGEIDVWYDPIDDINTLVGSSDMAFAPNFDTFLVKQTQFNLIPLACINLAVNGTVEEEAKSKAIERALDKMGEYLQPQLAKWEKEFRKYLTRDYNTQKHLRRTQDEILAQNYGNVSGNNPTDYDHIG